MDSITSYGVAISERGHALFIQVVEYLGRPMALCVWRVIRGCSFKAYFAIRVCCGFAFVKEKAKEAQVTNRHGFL